MSESTLETIVIPALMKMLEFKQPVSVRKNGATMTIWIAEVIKVYYSKRWNEKFVGTKLSSLIFAAARD